METIGKPVEASRRSPTHIAGSALLHLLLLGVLVHQSASWIAPIRLPGSPHGTNLLLTYSPGRAPLQASVPNAKTQPKQSAATTTLPTPPEPKLKETTASPTTTSPASAQ